MVSEPRIWRARSPGDLSLQMPEVSAGDVSLAVKRSQRAFRDWQHLRLEDRRAALSLCRDRLVAKREELARLISMEIGKPLREARLEL
ncbi:MAG TPA: aldehyde dehydrogenase family protein, partial [Terrimicrobiaceae bacterium]